MSRKTKPALHSETAKIIPALVSAARLKRQLRQHLKDLGFEKSPAGDLLPPSKSKETYRALHRPHWAERLSRWEPMVDREWPILRTHFADGAEIEPTKINPRLEVVQADTWQSRLFRLASLTWSVPVSDGYGRRMRFLVWDETNEKLIGLIALTDPVFNLAARDREIGWTAADRKKRLVNMLDANVLGAVPPYNMLLCGKLVGCLVRTTEVRDAFRRKYGSSTGIISQEAKNPQLFAVTTTSSLGRSAMYNRMKLNNVTYFAPIGFTTGYGHFHIPQGLFEEMRLFLDGIGHPYSGENRFGNGPNWRLRTIRACLGALGMNEELLRHHLQREVFVSLLADNALKLLRGEQERPNWRSLDTAERVATLARDRWIIGRAMRRPEYRRWNKDMVLNQIMGGLNNIISADASKAANAGCL